MSGRRRRHEQQHIGPIVPDDGAVQENGTSGTANKSSPWDIVLRVASLVFVLAVLVIVIVQVAKGNSSDATYLAVGKARSTNVVGAAGETNAAATFKIVFDLNGNHIDYHVRPNSATSTITGIYLRGPIQVPGSEVANMAVALCGVPVTACNTIATPGVVEGTINQLTSDTQTNQDLRPLMYAFRADPQLYYVEILTSGKPTSPGAMRFDFQ